MAVANIQGLKTFTHYIQTHHGCFVINLDLPDFYVHIYIHTKGCCSIGQRNGPHERQIAWTGLQARLLEGGDG